MILKSLLIAHVLAQHVQGFVSGLIGHLENACTIPSRTRQKSAPQGMPRIAARLEAGLGRERLYDKRDTLGGEAGPGRRIAAMHAVRTTTRFSLSTRRLDKLVFRVARNSPGQWFGRLCAHPSRHSGLGTVKLTTSLVITRWTGSASWINTLWDPGARPTMTIVSPLASMKCHRASSTVTWICPIRGETFKAPCPNTGTTRRFSTEYWMKTRP